MRLPSLWRANPLPAFRGAHVPDEIDVAIIGGGITGLTAAHLLTQAGRRVAVFERERIGAGETGNTSAHLTYVTDLRLATLVKRFGQSAARRVWEGGALAINHIERTVESGGIGCGFRRVPGHLCSPFVTADADDRSGLQADEWLARELGFSAELLEHGPLTGRPALRFADQALFHPLDYLGGLALAIQRNGSFVCEMAEVGHVIQDPLAVVVDGRTIACGDVIIATHVPMVGSTKLLSATLFQTKIYPYSSYVVGAPLPDGDIQPGLYSDTADPYYYLRVHRTARGSYAIFGGADHKTGQESHTDSCFDRVESVLRTLIPGAIPDRRWSGQVIETDDGLPFIGKTADHQYVATGYAGNGLTMGTLAGMMLHDAVLGRGNPWSDLFDPHRKASSVSAVSTVIAENIDYPRYYVTDRLRPHGGTPESIKPGEGRVLTIDGARVACHRTDDGTLIKVSAACTHMGCLVRWNDAERTWDCPCHGSRFTPEGLVIGGPAESPLPRLSND